MATDVHTENLSATKASHRFEAKIANKFVVDDKLSKGRCECKRFVTEIKFPEIVAHTDTCFLRNP